MPRAPDADEQQLLVRDHREDTLVQVRLRLRLSVRVRVRVRVRVKVRVRVRVRLRLRLRVRLSPNLVQEQRVVGEHDCSRVPGPLGKVGTRH